MLAYAWLIPAIPALSFVLILAFGKRLPHGGSEIGIAAVALAFVLALGTGVGWIQRVNHPPEVAPHATEEAVAAPAEEGGHGEEAAAAEEEHHVVPPVVREVTWIDAGAMGSTEDVTVGTMVDGLSTIMLLIVTIVSLLVHIYSTDYVAGDRRYTHFFAFLSLFTASMLFFVLAQSTLQMIVGWELVGLCSFVLIGHWWEEKPNSDAALKAFLTNRVGDVGLLVGMIILYYAAGRSFDIIKINEMAAAGEIRHLLLLVASCCLMAAVMSKSGQFILHTWLPDAMAGPTPVSALIHAATMVVAGIYMIARLYSVFWQGFQIGGSNINLMAVIGAVTLVFGALLAFVQNDIKKVLAYSTISQLGYMVMALGVGAWTAAIFHLFTHAFFKACLFLGAGSLSHAVHSFDIKEDMGGMRKYMPVTFATFMVGTGALMGLFPLAGFWSKDEILAGANGLGGEGGYKLMLVMGVIGAFCTCAYMTRVVWYVFFGQPRGAAAAHPPHESGPRITIPLVILATLGALAGLVNLPDTGVLSWVPENVALRFEHFVEPTAAYFPSAVDTSFAHPEFTFWIAVLSTLAALVGISLAYAWFWKGLGPHGITQRSKAARAGYTVLENKYYLDFLYTDVIAGGTKGPVAKAANWINQNVIDGVVNLVGRSAVEGGQWVYTYVDQGVVDTIVNGSGATAEGSGQLLRKQQTGKVQAYGAYLFAGATLLAAIFVAIASAN
jgi:NADH-quinone oxidoreductase subunit L